MTPRIDVDERRRRLGLRHHLARPGAPTDLPAIAGDLVGLHASDPVSIFLAARARAPGITPASLEQALYDDRTLVKMLAMRRTLFVVPVDLVPVLQAASSDAIAKQEHQRLAKELVAQGITKDADRWMRKWGAAAVDALEARGEATATELIADVPQLGRKIVLAEGKKYEANVSVGTRLLIVISAEGKVVRGRPRGSWISTQYRWAPMSAWLPAHDPIPADEARAELARRWLRAFGPATEADLKWWTGWTLGQTRAALAAVDAATARLDGDIEAHVLPDDLDPTPTPEPWVALLPALDPTAMGWTHRDWYLGPHKDALFDRNGNIGPTIWSGGRIVGGWAHRQDGTVALRLLEDVGRATTRAIDAEAHAVEAWLGDVRFTPRFRTPLERELTA